MSNHNFTRDSALPSYGTVIIGGVKTAGISRDGLAKQMISDCVAARTESRRPKLIFDMNGHRLSLVAIDGKALGNIGHVLRPDWIALNVQRGGLMHGEKLFLGCKPIASEKVGT